MDVKSSKMSPVELQAAIDQCLSKMDLLVATAKSEGRDFSEKERAEFDTVESEARLLNATRDRKQKSDEIQARVNAGEFANVPDFLRTGGGGGGPRASWQTDSRGCRYAILSREDKATSLLPSKSRNEFGHFILAKLFGPSASTPQNVRASLSGDTNHLGGVFVPEELFGGIIDLARAKSVLMQAGMRTLLMNSDSLVVPKLGSDVVIALRGQNDAIAESDPTFGSVRLVAKSAACMTRVSRELVEDSPEMLAEMIGQLMTRSMATTIDGWGLDGAGGTEPEGLFLQSGIGSTGSIGQIDWTDVNAAAVAIEKLNHTPTAMILSPERYADLFNIETGNGTTAARGWLDVPPSLRNVQFLSTTNCPNEKAMLGDFSKFAMGLRSSPLVEATQVGGDAFQNHQVLIKITARLDFVALDSAAFHSLTGLT